MNKPVCNDDNCTIEETECGGGTNGNWPEPIEEDDNGLIPKPGGPGPERKPSCCGEEVGNWPHQEADGGKKPRPIKEIECCGGGEVRNWPDPNRNPSDEPDGGKKPCGGKKPTPGGPKVMVGDEELNWPDGNWPLPDISPDEDGDEFWQIKPGPVGGPIGGPHIPIEDPILDGKDPHEGIGPYRVIGSILDGKEPSDGSSIGPHPI